jgi:predicted alpha/beta superfamily hydrolase
VGAGLTAVRRGLAALALALAGTVSAAGVTASFEADLRAEIAAGRFDPARDAVSLRGGVAPLAWDRGLPLAPAEGGPAGVYRATVHFPKPPFGGQPVAHKFRIERAGQRPDEGWESGANHVAGLDGAAPRVARVFGSPATPPPARLTGTIVSLDPLPTRHVAPRPVQVWLPPGYAAAAPRRYPVLYLHDGQNVFDGRAAGAEWMVDETAQRLVLERAIEPLIVVAVPSGAHRLHELTPAPGRLGRETVGGGVVDWARFLVEDLKPAVDARFRTRPGPVDTAVGGSSVGALAALWLALHRGETFGAALVVSPALWWADAAALRDVEAWRAGGPARPRLWLDIGGREGEPHLGLLRRACAALRERGWSREAGTLECVEDADGSHDELSWAARVEPMLRFLHGRPPR